jgi:transcriptional regulator with XRE-family HTH domain
MARSKNTKLQKQVGERLAALRHELHLGQLEIAAELKVTKQCWSNYETGKRTFDIDVAVRLCRRKHVPLDWIYFGELRTFDDEKFPRRLTQAMALLRLKRADKVRRKQERASAADS